MGPFADWRGIVSVRQIMETTAFGTGVSGNGPRTTGNGLLLFKLSS